MICLFVLINSCPLQVFHAINLIYYSIIILFCNICDGPKLIQTCITVEKIQRFMITFHLIYLIILSHFEVLVQHILEKHKCMFNVAPIDKIWRLSVSSFTAIFKNFGLTIARKKCHFFKIVIKFFIILFSPFRKIMTSSTKLRCEISTLPIGIEYGFALFCIIRKHWSNQTVKESLNCMVSFLGFDCCGDHRQHPNSSIS